MGRVVREVLGGGVNPLGRGGKVVQVALDSDIKMNNASMFQNKKGEATYYNLRKK